MRIVEVFVPVIVWNVGARSPEYAELHVCSTYQEAVDAIIKHAEEVQDTLCNYNYLGEFGECYAKIEKRIKVERYGEES